MSEALVYFDESESVEQIGPPTASASLAMGGLYARFGKRAVDLVLASLILMMVLPVMLAVAAGIRLTLGKGVVFRQQRVGRHGEDFTMLKFRTMKYCRRQEQRPYALPDRRQTHKHPNDPRHTRLGRLLRKTSLDELPQLINVLRGEMSLVGPRPEIAEVVERYGLRTHPRHQVLPGITGLWQTNARNDGAMLHECFDHDAAYLQSMSFVADVRILKRTAEVLFSPGGR